MRFWARVLVLSLVSAGWIFACGPDPSSLTACENVAFKMRLCDVSEPPSRARDIDFCGGDLTPWERCELDCWYEASCVDWRQEQPGPDTSKCLADCADEYCPDCTTLPQDQFDCGDGIMLMSELVCDGDEQCPDGSDESDCP